ncbi:HNH endonuclease, partial [Glaciihabitans arcticus]
GPVVKILVAAESLDTRTGHARIEGSPTPVSVQTAERLACTGTTVPILFDSAGQILDLGREQRLFTKRQKQALAARDGGCMWLGCDRPACWTEAHHIDHWARDGGATDTADGMLLCKHHHLLLHNNHWEILRTGAEYWLVPPPDIDPDQTPILLRSKSAALTELLARAR